MQLRANYETQSLLNKAMLEQSKAMMEQSNSMLELMMKLLESNK